MYNNAQKFAGSKYVKKRFTKYSNLKMLGCDNNWLGKNGKRLSITKKKDDEDTTIYRCNPENWTDAANKFFENLNDPWDVRRGGYPKMPNLVATNDKKNYHKTTVNGGERQVVIKEDKVSEKNSPFANIPIIEWNEERAVAHGNIRDHPEEENTVYKFMTEEQWINAHWNKGEGHNLPYNCKNKYLQLNKSLSKGKQQWLKDTLADTIIKYDLIFCRVSSIQKLADEDATIGKNWIMKKNPDLVVPPNHNKDIWIPHRICGTVIIGVMIPRGYKDFTLKQLGDKIAHFVQPKTSFEYRGIYGCRT